MTTPTDAGSAELVARLRADRMKWRIILPKQPIPWDWGMWSLLDGPSHFLAENERGERAYVSKEELIA